MVSVDQWTTILAAAERCSLVRVFPMPTHQRGIAFGFGVEPVSRGLHVGVVSCRVWGHRSYSAFHN